MSGSRANALRRGANWEADVQKEMSRDRYDDDVARAARARLRKAKATRDHSDVPHARGATVPMRRGVIPPPPSRAPPSRRAYNPVGYKKGAYTSSKYYRTPSSTKKAPMRRKASPYAPPDSVGGTIGGWLGHGIQGVVKALTGFGDYKVASNSLMRGKLGGDPPIIKNSAAGGFRVRHREYLGDVTAATTFTPVTYPLNPGMLSTFPWCAQIADSFEQYRLRGAVFEFKSMSSDAVLATSASSALGTVIMSTQYNALDTPFTDKRTMENYEFANSAKPSCSFFHPIECKRSVTPVSELYVRNTVPPATGDLRLYDLGNFTIACQGMQNTAVGQTVGELWVTYEVEFLKPKLLVGGGALLTDHYYGTGASIFTSAAPFGSVGQLVQTSGSNLGTTLQIAAVAPYAANTILFPSYLSNGRYLITYAISGSVASAGLPDYFGSGTTVHIDVLGAKVKIFNGSTSSYRDSGVSTEAGMRYMIEQVLDINGVTSNGSPAGIALLFSGAMPTGTQKLDLMITQLNPTIN